MKHHVLLLALTLGGAAVASAQSNWLQWRGTNRDGQFQGPAWPEKLDTNHLQRTWGVELGPSYSGPIVSGERVFTTETKDKKFEVVTAFDRKTGKELWRAQWEGAMTVPFFAKANGDWIRATPACDGESLFISGMRDVRVCLVAQGDRILALDQRGQLFLLRANKAKYEQLDKRKLTDSETWAHLAVADDQLFVRELHALSAYQWRGGDSKVALNP